MHYTIYETKNMLNGKIYVGLHKTTDLSDSYLGSGILVCNAIKKYGRHNFTKTVLFVFSTKDEMIAKEKEIVTEEFCTRDDTYNIAIGGQGGTLNNKGMATAYNTVTKSFEKVTTEKLRTTDTLKGMTYQHVTVRDKDGVVFNVTLDDPRYMSGELEFVCTGRLMSEEAKKSISEKAKSRLKIANHHSGITNVWHPDLGFAKFKGEELIQKLQAGWTKKHPSVGTVIINKDGKNTRVNPERIEEMLSQGWLRGSKFIARSRKESSSRAS